MLIFRKQCDSDSGLLTLVPRGFLLLFSSRLGDRALGDGVVLSDGGVSPAIAKSHGVDVESGSSCSWEASGKFCWDWLVLCSDLFVNQGSGKNMTVYLLTISGGLSV